MVIGYSTATSMRKLYLILTSTKKSLNSELKEEMYQSKEIFVWLPKCSLSFRISLYLLKFNPSLIQIQQFWNWRRKFVLLLTCNLKCIKFIKPTGWGSLSDASQKKSNLFLMLSSERKRKYALETFNLRSELNSSIFRSTWQPSGLQKISSSQSLT